MSVTTCKNILLAILLSLFMTLVIAVLHTFSPVIAAILSLLWRGIVSRGPERNGVLAATGGFSGSFLAFILVAPILFLITFALLHKASRKN